MDVVTESTTRIRHGIDVVIANSLARKPRRTKTRLHRHTDKSRRKVAAVPQWHCLDAADAVRAESLVRTYTDCQAKGFLVLIVTLSTEVTSDYASASEKFTSLWDRHFVQKVEKRLPKNPPSALFIYDYEKQKSHGQTFVNRRSGSFWQSGYWHFHGLLAVHPSVSDRIWKDGTLNHHLANDLCSFAFAGKYRPYRVTSYHIEPVRDLNEWVDYMLRESEQKFDSA